MKISTPTQKSYNKTKRVLGLIRVMAVLSMLIAPLMPGRSQLGLLAELGPKTVSAATLPTVNPTINASPDAVSFGSVSVGATSLTQTVTIANIANSGPTISGGGHATCAVTASGGVKCWGWNGYGQLGNGDNYNRSAPTDVIGLQSGVVSVQNGYHHTCALLNTGGVKCWGYNGNGMLGDGSNSSRNTPVDVVGLSSGVLAIAVGLYHTCALTNKGELKCWGWNGYGQLGDATQTQRNTPGLVNGFTTGASAIDAGGYHTCALSSSGGVKCWGYNGEGQLGNGSNTMHLTAVDVNGLTSGVKAITTGERWSCAITTAGAAKCWGWNSHGQLGNGSNTNSNVPVSVSGLNSGVSSMEAGLHHTCALMSSGGVKCWGYNGNGMLGDGGNTTRDIPADVTGLTSGVGSIATGYYHTCAVLTTGQVKCWGYNGYGQLGDGTVYDRNLPQNTDGTVGLFATPNLNAATGSGLNTCAITASGGAKCWGYNGHGQTGNGKFDAWTRAPMDVVGLTSGVTKIAANNHHACAIHNGALKCWGYNGHGELGNGSNTSSAVPVQVTGLTSGVTDVAVGGYFTCAIHNGAVKCFGHGGYGEQGNGSTSSNTAPVAVSGLNTGATTLGAGYYHACAAISGGGMKCWGWNVNGQLGNGGTSGANPAPIAVSGLSSTVITQISAEWEHTCALTSGGGAKCWGYGGNGQLGNGGTSSSSVPVDVSSLTSGVAAIETAYHHTCALTTGGGVKCWGYNGWGNLGDNSITSHNVAADVQGLTSGVTALTSGGYHSCATLSDGNMKCWGYGGYGQLGNGLELNQYKPSFVSTMIGETPGPVGVLSITNISLTGVNAGDFSIVSGGTCGSSFPVTLARGASCTVLVKANPSGTGTREANLTLQSNDADQAVINIPLDVTTSDPDIDVSPSSLNFGNVNVGTMSPSQFITIRNLAPAGGAMGAGPTSNHTCSVTSVGGVKCWGKGDNGQLGNGANNHRYGPVDVSGLLTGTTVVAVGGNHTCALTSSGGVKCWGYNAFGQLGNGNTTSSNAPVDVNGLTSGVNAITAGDNFSCALLNNGGMKCWGQNSNGQLGNGSTTASNVPVDVNGLTSGVASIESGADHTCALLSTTGAKCWGYNGLGSLGNGSTTNSNVPVDVSGMTSGVSALAGGGFHTCAVLSTGGVKCWGYNGEGQIGDGTNTQRTVAVNVSSLSSGVKAIDAGYRHTCALLTSGGLKCWGYNANGMLGDGGNTARNVPADVVGLTSGVGDIATGQYHTCATLLNGGGVCWGYGGFGQLGNGTTPDRNRAVAVSGQPNLFDTNSINAASAGGLGSCGLTASKGLKCWGADDYHQTGDFDGAANNRWAPVDVFGLISGTKQVVNGRIHACAVLADGSMKCWGYNGEGELGDGSTTQRQSPTDVSGFGSGSGGTITDVSAGYQTSCALTSSGSIKCFGWNAYGQLGEGSTNNRYAPTPVTGITSGATAVDNGTYHTCAIVSGGVKCWGYNGEGQLGDSTNSQRLTPVNVTGLGSGSGVTSIAMGQRHTCVVANGGVKCWGWNAYGQLGTGGTLNSDTPVDVSGLTSGVTDVASSEISTCALLTSGAVKCWGYGGEGQLGNGGTTSSNTPVQVSSLTSGVTAIGGSEFRHHCAVQSGAAKCWGYGGYGNLGSGGTSNSSVPVDVSGLTSGVTDVDAGRIHTCAIVSGAMKCWGYNGYGQLGDGTTSQRNVPTDVSGLSSGVTQIAMGEYYTCALAGGVTKCWGYNGNGQLGDGLTTQHNTPNDVAIAVSGVAQASVSERHSCAVTTDGALKCWGQNNQGQLGDGTTTNRTAPIQVSGLVSGVVQVATGEYFTCALLDTGGVKCWGYGANGRLGRGSNTQTSTPVDVSGLTSGVSSIGAGDAHACATLTAGGVKCWGYNANGALGNGNTTESNAPVDVSGTSGTVFTSVKGGYRHTCALTSAGGAKCWGYNANGMLGNGNTTQSTVPVDVSGLTSGVTSIAAATYHSCAILSSGYMTCWGYNAEGELGDGINTQRTTASANVANLINGVAAAIGALNVTGIDVVTGDSNQFAITTGGTCSSSVPFSLAAGAGCTVAVKFAPTEYGPKLSAVRVNSNDPLSPTIYVSLTGTGVGAELAIAKTGPAFATQGVGFGYSILVTNTGNSASTGSITVTDGLPAGMSFVSGSGGSFSCAAGGQTITCTRSAALAISGTATININVNTSVPGTYANTASVVGGGDLSQSTSDTANTAVGAPPPDLTLNFGQPAPNLVANTTSTMPVTVTNIGTGPTAGPISITLNLPAGVSAPDVFTDTNTGWLCNTISQTVNCMQANSLLAGEVFTLGVPIMPNFSRIGTQPTITGTVQTTPETVTNNNNASMTASVPVAAPPTDVGIAKSVAPSTVTTGGAVVYTLNISNTTGVTATNVVVTDAIPAGLTGLSASNTFTTNNPTLSAGSTATWNLGMVGPNGVGSITISATAPSSAGTITNTTGITATNDITPSNNFASVPLVVSAVPPDLTTIIGQPSPNFVAGSPSNVPITVTNAVTAGATSGPITTTMTLPANTSAPASFSSGGNTCTTAGLIVTCVNPSPIAPGATNVIQVPVTPGVLTVGTQPAFNATTATPGESATGNNAAPTMTPSVAVAAAGFVNLKLTKTASVGTAAVGVAFDYISTVKNNGNIAATNVVLTSTIPATVGYNSSSATGGGTCNQSGLNVVCTWTSLASGATVTSTINVTP